jgi:DNA-binding NtrC family response regulator
MIKPKIMLVDDEVSLTEPGVGFLKLRLPDAEVYGAVNSIEAQAIINEHKPNILLLDINLNENINGFGVLQKALMVEPNAEVAIITGNVDEWMHLECQNNKIKKDRLIEKPLRLAKMLELVNEMIAHLNSEGKE